MAISTVVGAAAVGSCSHTAASAVEARTGCSSTNAAVGKPTTFELITVIIRTNFAAVMKPFGVLMQTTARLPGLVRLAFEGSGLRYSSRALSTFASKCVDRRLPTVESSEAATMASQSATAVVG